MNELYLMVSLKDLSFIGKIKKKIFHEKTYELTLLYVVSGKKTRISSSRSKII